MENFQGTYIEPLENWKYILKPLSYADKKNRLCEYFHTFRTTVNVNKPFPTN